MTGCPINPPFLRLPSSGIPSTTNPRASAPPPPQNASRQNAAVYKPDGRNGASLTAGGHIDLRCFGVSRRRELVAAAGTVGVLKPTRLHRVVFVTLATRTDSRNQETNAGRSVQ